MYIVEKYIKLWKFILGKKSNRFIVTEYKLKLKKKSIYTVYTVLIDPKKFLIPKEFTW